MRALALIADRLPRERLLAALSAPTDTDVLFEALRDTAAVGADLGQERDPLTEAFLRGASMKREMLKAEGGVLSARELAAHLGITPPPRDLAASGCATSYSGSMWAKASSIPPSR